MASEPSPPAPAAERVRHDMLHEARRLIDDARSQGLTLRLMGGLGVRQHCSTHELCARDYSDLDMVAPARQVRRLATFFASHGYGENFDVSTATANAELQFVRACEHVDEPGADRVHPDDHVDVFLGTFRMDHDIALERRLEIDPYTVSLSDLLLTKLQIFRLTDKDLRDIVTLLTDAEAGEQDGPRLINGRYIGALCAEDWGLFYDVTRNLQRVGESIDTFDLSASQTAQARHGVTRLIAAIDGAPKSVRWRLRARIGTRAPWHEHLDDQE